MISNRSRLWWQEFSIAGVVVALASCSAGSTIQPELDEFEEPGAVSGELAVYMADYDDGTSETTYFLRDAAGNERRLVFESEPDVTPGEMIKVWGTDRTEALEVKSFKLASKLAARGELGTQVQPLIGQPERTPRKLCPILVSVNGGTPPTTTGKTPEQSAQDAFLAGAGTKSDNAFMIENSYGKDKFTGKVYGPFPYTMTGCDYSGLSKAIRPMVPAATEGCQHYAFVMSKVPSPGCAWAGLGAVGSSDKPASETWYNGTVGCVAAVQEVMHNWGSLHSSSIFCNGAPATSGYITDTLAGCTHNEYGDKSDTLGGGCRHMNAWQKLYQKVWGGAAQGGPEGSCNAVRATASGTYNLYPTEAPCNGVQAIQIPFPGGKTRTFQGSTLTSWYLEYRASIGAFDTGIVPQVQARLGINPVLPTQTGPRGSRVWIPNSAQSTNMALTAGKSFTDPAGGLTVTVMSIDPSKAVVNIEYPGGSGGPVCLDGMNTPFTPPGADNCTDVPRTDGGVVNPTGSGGAGGSIGAGGAKVDAGRDAAGGAGGANPTGAGGNGVGGAGGSAGAGVGGSGVGGSGVGGSDTGAGGTATGSGGGIGVGGSTPTGAGTGTAGQGTGPSTTTGRPGAGDLDGGCACRIETAPKRPSTGAYLALLLGGLFASRRRRSAAKAGRAHN